MIALSICMVSVPAFAKTNLRSFVKANLATVQKQVPADFQLNAKSIKCVSKYLRDDNAGVCIIQGKSVSSQGVTALFAVEVGEESENGGIAIRGVSFLKQGE